MLHHPDAYLGRTIQVKITIPILYMALGLGAVVHPSHSDPLQGLTPADWSAISGQINPSAKMEATNNPDVLKAADPDPSDLFGYAMDISGDTLVISVVEDDSGDSGVDGDELDNSLEDSGAVYVFVRRGGEWEKQAYLKASNPGEKDWFGEAVAIDGDTLAVSAILEDSGATGVNGDQTDNSMSNTGAVYIFVREDGQWSQQAYLKSSNPYIYPDGYGNDYFGQTLALSGDTLVAGSPNKVGLSPDDPSSQSGIFVGSAYVFEREGGVWEQTAYLKAEVPRQFDSFGYSLAISEETIVVGVPYEDSTATGINGPPGPPPAPLTVDESDSGAAFVFEKIDGVWERTTYIKASNTGDGDYFGRSVDISGDTIVIGAPREDGDSTGVNGDQFNNGLSNSGAAYVFVRSEDGWAQEAYIKASNADIADNFGSAAITSDNSLFIGASNKRALVGGEEIPAAGAGYRFVRTDAVWQEEAFYQSPQPTEGEKFSTSAALNKRALAIGAYGADSGAGAAYAYTLAEIVALESGHSALWYNPEQSGHGLSIYALENDGIVAVWYVYDNEGRPLWLIGTGSHDGETALLDVQVAFGGFFPPSFDPADVVLSDWGQFEIAFSGCNEATFRWMPIEDSEYTSGEMAIQKLTQTRGATCATAMALQATARLSKGAAFDPIGAAQSALWYNPDQPGHGYSVYMLEDDQVVVVWYVFDDMGNPLWLIGTGSHNGESAVLTVNSAAGGLFPPLFSSEDVTLTEWGVMELRFLDCDSGVFSWMPNGTTGFEPGEVSVIRLTSSLGLGCDS